MANHVIIDELDEPITYTVGGTPQSEFAIPFPFFAASDIIVYVDDELVATADYTVAGLFVQNGDPVEGAFGSGTVTLDTAVSNVDVTIDRFVGALREDDFSSTAPLSQKQVNTALDKLTARDQDIHRSVLSLVQAATDAGFAAGATAQAFPVNALATTLSGITVPDAYDSIRTAGYRERGDGGDALYVRADAEPDYGGIQDEAGQWWVYGEDVVRAAAFGAYTGDEIDQYAALNDAIQFALSREHISEIVLPRGNFFLDSPIIIEPQTYMDGEDEEVSNSVRNIRIRGHGGNNASLPDKGIPGTRLYYRGEDDNGGFQIWSGFNVLIEDIVFRCQTDGLQCMVQVAAHPDPQFSGQQISFLRCMFLPITGISFTKGQVWVVDCKNVEFSFCWFDMGAGVERPSYGLWIGNTNDDEDPDFRNTLQSGVAGYVVARQCMFDADVALESAISCTFAHSTFGIMDNDPSDDHARGAKIVPVGLQKIGCLHLLSSTFSSEDETGPAVQQGDYAPMTSSSQDTGILIVEACVFRDRMEGLRIVRGWVHLGGNQWLPRVTDAKCIVIESGATGPITGFRNEDFSQAKRTNNLCIEDNRTDLATGPILVNAEPASSPIILVALSTYTDIISVTGLKIEGGRYMLRWQIQVQNTGIDAATVRCNPSVANVSQTVQRQTIPAGGHHCFTGSMIVKLTPNHSGGTSTTAVKVAIQQDDGATYVRALDGSAGQSFVQLERWDG
jgi:hypothetical protein